MTPPKMSLCDSLENYIRDHLGEFESEANFRTRNFRQNLGLLYCKDLVERVSGWRFEAKWKPFCDSPIPVEVTKSGKYTKPAQLAMLVPCRKCPKCLRVKSTLWQRRSVWESKFFEKTWSVTLTFSPAHLSRLMMEASARQKGTYEQALEKAAYADVQKFFKRLRKNRNVQFRYCAVAEYGEANGRLHYHLFLHQVTGKLLKADIEAEWPSFTHCRLVKNPEAQAGYLAKYLTKNPVARMRASRFYGRIDKFLDTILAREKAKPRRFFSDVTSPGSYSGLWSKRSKPPQPIRRDANLSDTKQAGGPGTIGQVEHSGLEPRFERLSSEEKKNDKKCSKFQNNPRRTAADNEAARYRKRVLENKLAIAISKVHERRAPYRPYGAAAPEGLKVPPYRKTRGSSA